MSTAVGIQDRRRRRRKTRNLSTAIGIQDSTAIDRPLVLVSPYRSSGFKPRFVPDRKVKKEKEEEEKEKKEE